MNNNWVAFVKYAKEHPHLYPRSHKARSELYKSIVNTCKCGSRDKICEVLQIKNVIPRAIYSPSKDAYLLQAKLKAYEEIVRDKDDEIKDLNKYIQTLERHIRKKNVASAHF